MSGGDQRVCSASMIAVVTSSVSAVPPMSRVRTPAPVTASIAASTRAGLGVQAEVVQHQRAGGDGADRVADALGRRCPGRSRGPARTCCGNRRSGFRFALAARPRLPARAEPRSDRMSAFRLEATTTDRSSGCRTNFALIASTSTLSVADVRVVLGDPLEGLVPQHHAVLLGVGLGDAGDLLHGAGAGQVEREPHDPLAALLGEQRGLQGDLVARAAAGQVPAAEAGVLAFAVLPDDDPVEFGVVGLAQRGLDAGVELDRADVGPLVEVLGDVQPQPPQADVVRDVAPSRRRRSRWRRSSSGSPGRPRPSSGRSAA